MIKPGLPSVGLAAALVLAGSPVNGLDITLDYRTSTGIGEPDGTPHDAAGIKLQRVMRAAADYWEGIFPVDHDLNIRFRYSDLETDDGTPWASARLYEPDPIDSDGHIKHGTIRFDEGSDFFFDQTPLDNSEFTLKSLVYGDAQSVTQGGYGGSVPVPLEITYEGSGNPSSIDKSEGDAFSIAIHEIGHLLGFAPFGRNDRYNDEVSDGDIDFNPFSPGESGGVGVSVDQSDDHEGHFLEPSDGSGDSIGESPLMGVSLGGGERELPSAVDVLAIAKINGWDEVNLPRRDLVADSDGETNWMQRNRWIGGRVPDGGSDAYLRDPSLNRVVVGASVPDAANLFASEAVEIQIEESGSLRVHELVELTDFAEAIVEGSLTASSIDLLANSKIAVMGGGEVTLTDPAGRLLLEDLNTGVLNAGTVHMNGADLMNHRGEITMSGGRFVGGSNAVFNEASGEIRGGGEFTQVMELKNTGKIIAGQGGLIFEDGTGLIGQFDLDGDEQGSDALIHAESGSITFRGRVADEFNDVMRVDKGQSVRFERSNAAATGGTIRMASDSELYLDGGQTGEEIAALVASDLARLGGEVWVAGVGIVAAPTIRFEGRDASGNGSAVSLAPDSSLFLNGDVIYNGVEQFGGPSTSVALPGTSVYQNGDAFVVADTVVGRVGMYDWDGATEDEATKILGGSRFDLYADSIDDPMRGPAGHDGEIFVDVDGGLGVHTTGSWRLNGSLEVASSAVVDGADIENAGTISGHGLIDVRVMDVGGLIDPGSSPGELTLAGYTGSADGRVRIELGGLDAGTEHDLLTVTGFADLAGTLEIDLYEDYVPTLYDTYTVLDASHLDGRFDVVDWSSMDSVFDTESNSTWAVTYDTDTADVSLTWAMTGDANLDGVIGQSDLDAVLLNWGDKLADWSSGDLNSDGLVSQGDLDVVLLNWGAGAAPSLAPVPEPSTLLLLAVAGLTQTRRGRKSNGIQVCAALRRANAAPRCNEGIAVATITPSV